MSKATATKQSTRAAFAELRDDLNTVLLEREDEVSSIVLALLARQHVFQLGVPGTGKSLLATETTLRIGGASIFEYLMSRFTTPEEIFGPPSLAALRDRDVFERNGSGMLQESSIAFLDELWKANSAILNTLLPILNERLYREAGKVSSVPLQTMICASNEMPQGEDLGAVYDRILFRHVVQPLTDSGLRQLMLNPPRIGQPNVTISQAQLAQAQSEVDAVNVTEKTIDTMLRIRQELASVKGVFVSPRRWNACIAVVKAAAWMAGRTSTEDEDLLPLVHCLWCDPEHRSAVEIAVVKVAAPALRSVLQLLDAAHELSRNYHASQDENERTEALMKLRASAEKANKLAKRAGEKGRSTARKVSQMAGEAIEADKRRLAERYGASDLFEEV